VVCCGCAIADGAVDAAKETRRRAAMERVFMAA
jgi:hypothetical protein